VKWKKLSWASKAQTAIELAVFGAILIFILGVLIRYATNFNFVQNQSLEAMRIAFRESFLAGQAESASRNSASILFIEDRKEAENTKYGSLSRTPYIVSGNGIFTQNLYLATDWGHTENLPIMDVFINGRHFTFTTAGFKAVRLALTLGEGADDFEKNHCKRGPVESYPNPPTNSKIIGWDSDCLGPGKGCATLLTRIERGDLSKFCNSSPCPYNSGFDVNNRFDLDRDGATDVTGATTRQAFAWQWDRVKATNRNINLKNGINVSLDVDGDLKEEQIIKMISQECVIYTPHETTVALSSNVFDAGKRIAQPGAIKIVFVIDPQEGDLDFSYNTVDQNKYNLPQPGLTDHSSMLSMTRPPGPGRDGTGLEVMEGRLYGTGQFARQTQKQDRIDIIERKIQLSNDTGRMYNCIDADPDNGCDNPDVRVVCPDPFPKPVPWPVNSKGFVTETKDYVSCCSGANSNRTCFDRKSRVLYVRSAVQDTRGRRWITDVERAQE